MGKFIKKFTQHSEYEVFANSDEYIKPNVSFCVTEKELHYNKIDIKAVKFSSPNACTLAINNLGARNAEYSTDYSNWSTWDGSAISFGDGTDVYVRGNNNNDFKTRFIMTGSNVSVEGNIMCLLSYEEDLTTIPSNNCFKELFAGCTSLVKASKLKLPATTLTEYCYLGTFTACTSLVNAPELPATTLTNLCYSEMFSGCTSLVDAPELPATTLAMGCYNSMFEGCTSLVNAPSILPATSLTTYCYKSMFERCTSLVNAPALPATTLAEGCYGEMFRYCSSLNHIKMMATDISASSCISSWVNGVSTTGTMLCATGMSTVIPSGDSGIPSGWTVTEVAS